MYMQNNCTNNLFMLCINLLFLLHALFFLQIYCCNSIPNELKFDCLPKGRSNQMICEEISCCWTSANQSETKWPWCYYPECYNNYDIINVSDTNTGIVAFYNLTGNLFNNYKKNIKMLRLDIVFETPQRLRITVSMNSYIILITGPEFEI